jgi:ComF family protein
MKNRIKPDLLRLADDLICLVFPRICACCGNSLWKHEEIICTSCDFHLPRTRFHLESDNPADLAFRGRVFVENATAFLYFNKGNKAQRLVHLLKYKGRKDIGIFLGEQHGRLLRESPAYQAAEMILPVPLHKKKLMKRGYNQSEQYAIGIGKAMNIPVNSHILERSKFSETQTKKSRFDRWKNVSDLFTAKDTSLVEGKHVLLVDDVITTGATLESCIQVLSSVPGIRVSVAAIAMTVR